MAAPNRGGWVGVLAAVIALCAAGSGCHSLPCKVSCPDGAPRELAKVSLPDYVIEPPDVLLIDALRVEPLPPYRISTGDVLLIGYSGEAFPSQPLGGAYTVEPDGVINLGPTYGSVRLQGKTLEEARAILEKHLQQILKPEAGKAGQVSVSLYQYRGLQQVRGEHLVRPDGTVGLGTYGKVHVSGLTLEQAKAAIEEQLGQFLLKPEVTVDVLGYNSKVFYIVIDQASAGDQVIRLPAHGNETVLDALGQINGIPPIASKNRVWLARPNPDSPTCYDVFPVDWKAVSRCGSPATNYQIYPGDRIVIQADPWIRTDHFLAKVIAPIERVLGVTLLGATTYTAVQRAVNPNLFFSGGGTGTGNTNP